MEIRKIYPQELPDFLHSEEYAGFEHLPISSKRVFSYFNNPRKNEELPALYLLYSEGELAAYRSILHDRFQTSEGKWENMAWISGSWTHPKFRKRGLSKILLDEVSRDTGQEMMVTNYGLTYHLYSKRADMEQFRVFDGQRFYYRLPLGILLPPKSGFLNKIKPLLKVTDAIGNFFLDFRFLFYKKRKFQDITSADFDEKLQRFIDSQSKNALFKRNTAEFKWIMDYPWMLQKEEDDAEDKKYHFSTSARRFEQKPLIIRKAGKIKGLLFYTLRDEMLKINYVFGAFSEKEEFTDYIFDLIRKEKISFVLVTDEEMIRLLKKKGGFIYSKVWKKGVFGGKKLLGMHPEIREKEIYMGDGDTIFT